MTALIAAAAALPAAVAAAIAWTTFRLRQRRQYARLRRRLFEVGEEIRAERDAALDALERAASGDRA